MVTTHKEVDKQNKQRFLQAVWAQTPKWHEIREQLGDDHLAVQIDQQVDQLDLSSLIDAYAGRGSPAYPPQPLLKVVLYELRKGRPKPTQWFEDLQWNEIVQWLAGGLQPSLASLYTFRDRLEPFVDQWNQQVLERAIKQGYTDASRAALDGTTLAANASRHKLVSAATLARRLEYLENVCIADQLSLATGPLPRWMGTSCGGRAQQRDRYQQAAQRMQELQSRNQQRRKDKRKKVEKIQVCVTDPDAVLGRDKEKTFRPLYNVQVVSDLDSGLVLAYEVLTDISEANLAGPMLQRMLELTGHKPKELFADSAYATPQDLAVYDLAGVTLYAPLGENSFTEAKRAGQERQIDKSEFRWVPEQHTYRCPQGHLLDYEGKTARQRSSGERVALELYRCSPEHCVGCPLQAACTATPEKGRTVRRHEHEELMQRQRERMAVSQKEYQRQRPPCERIFGDMKEHRGARRLSGRGRWRGEIQVGLTALAYNLIIVAKLADEKTTHCHATKPEKLAA